MLKGLALALSLPLVVAAQAHAATDALDEVNAVRVKRGLPKFVRDEKLSEAAAKCADYRATKLISGHTSNDFSFVPAGSSASAAGCAAWSPEMGWGSCCTYESYKVAGAAWSKGRDGRRYMHLFVRNSGGGDSSSGTTTTYDSSGRGRRGRR
jgi:hypothetical protein